jgi:hypothetical protein
MSSYDLVLQGKQRFELGVVLRHSRPSLTLYTLVAARMVC